MLNKKKLNKNTFLTKTQLYYVSNNREAKAKQNE